MMSFIVVGLLSSPAFAATHISVTTKGGKVGFIENGNFYWLGMKADEFEKKFGPYDLVSPNSYPRHDRDSDIYFEYETEGLTVGVKDGVVIDYQFSKLPQSVTLKGKPVKLTATLSAREVGKFLGPTLDRVSTSGIQQTAFSYGGEVILFYHRNGRLSDLSMIKKQAY